LGNPPIQVSLVTCRIWKKQRILLTFAPYETNPLSSPSWNSATKNLRLSS